MIFKSKNKNVQHKVTVNIAGQNIKQVDHTKFLGYTQMKIVLEISCQLCFNESIKNRRNNSKSKTSLKLKNFKELYNAMVCPYMTYCDINWESTYPTRPKSIYIAQKKIVRLKFSRNFSAFVQVIKNNEYI